MPTPSLLKNRIIDVSFATSGYCQARCESCVWPFMSKYGNVMSDADFHRLMQRFSGYEIGELCLNVINEPFIDKTILSKLASLTEADAVIRRIFFSSNWLIPQPQDLERMVGVLRQLSSRPDLNSISLNATISGIDEPSYDKLQAGRDLADAIVPYRALDFADAVRNVVGMARLLEQARIPKVTFDIKAYGNEFTADQMMEFWRRKLGVSSLTEWPFLQVSLNRGYTTFARFRTGANSHLGHCRTNWLDSRLVIGPTGDVGLCCEDGLRQVIVGNLLESSLDHLVASGPYQDHLKIVLGLADAPPDHPCLRCQHFERAGHSQAGRAAATVPSR